MQGSHPHDGSRILWLDYLKGMAIILVVFGHSPYLSKLPAITFNIAYSFHMPIFLFVAGYLFNPDTPWRNFVKKRFNTLLRPYLFATAIFTLVYIVFRSDQHLGWHIFWALYANGPNLTKLALHLWFLPHLFIVALFVWSLFHFFRFIDTHKATVFFLVLFFLAIGYYTSKLFWNINLPDFFSNSFNNLIISGLLDNPAYLRVDFSQPPKFIIKGLPLSLDILMLSSAFFLLGYWIKLNRLENILRKHLFGWLSLILFISLHFFFNSTIDLNLRRYDNLLISSLMALSGIFFFSYLANLSANTKHKCFSFLGYVGRYSLIIYIFHQLFQSKSYYTVSTFQPNFLFLSFVIALCAGILLPLGLNFVLLERFRFFRYWFYSR